MIINAKNNKFLAGMLLSVCIAFPMFARARYTATQSGTAVYYSDKMDRHSVSLKGEKYDKSGLTAAHKSYPLGSSVRVTNIANNKSVVVKINDRMNPRSKAVIDLSRKAAEDLDMIRGGHAKVRLELVSNEGKRSR